MNDVIKSLGLVDQISSVRDRIVNGSGVVLAEVKVFLSKLMNCRVNLNNSSVDAVPDKSRRRGPDTKSTMLC